MGFEPVRGITGSVTEVAELFRPVSVSEQTAESAVSVSSESASTEESDAVIKKTVIIKSLMDFMVDIILIYKRT
jgi:hypothetical protein